MGTKAHIRAVASGNPADPFTGGGTLNAGSTPTPFSATIGTPGPFDFLAVADDGSSEMIGKSVFCSNNTTPSVLGGIVYGD